MKDKIAKGLLSVNAKNEVAFFGHATVMGEHHKFSVLCKMMIVIESMSHFEGF